MDEVQVCLSLWKFDSKIRDNIPTVYQMDYKSEYLFQWWTLLYLNMFGGLPLLVAQGKSARFSGMESLKNPYLI